MAIGPEDHGWPGLLDALSARHGFCPGIRQPAIWWAPSIDACVEPIAGQHTFEACRRSDAVAAHAIGGLATYSRPRPKRPRKRPSRLRAGLELFA